VYLSKTIIILRESSILYSKLTSRSKEWSCSLDFTPMTLIGKVMPFKLGSPSATPQVVYTIVEISQTTESIVRYTAVIIKETKFRFKLYSLLG
jgi:hypothetical protein